MPSPVDFRPLRLTAGKTGHIIYREGIILPRPQREVNVMHRETGLLRRFELAATVGFAAVVAAAAAISFAI